MENPNYKTLPLCSNKVLKDAIDFLELALIEAHFQYPNRPEKNLDPFENQVNVDKLREFMLKIAEPLFSAKSLADLIPYKYIYRDMWRKLFIISCKLCVDYDDYLEEANSCCSLTSNETHFEDTFSLDMFDNAMYEFGFVFGESLEVAIEKMVERVARFGFGDTENKDEQDEKDVHDDVDDDISFELFGFANQDDGGDSDDSSLF